MLVPVFAVPFSPRPFHPQTRAGKVRHWLSLFALLVTALCPHHAQAQQFRSVNSPSVSATPAGTTPPEARQAMHREESWLSVAAHLPDPATATSENLEMAADVLRARRFPDDAIDFYGAALRRGGNEERLLNKMGVTELALHRTQLAHSYFQLALKRNRKNADAWNNLGASEYMGGSYRRAISSYRKAVKLSPRSAIFHVNLGTAFVEEKQFDEAGKEFALALDIDPEIGTPHDSAAGIAAHVLTAADHARYCFEMAKVYAARGEMDAMLRWLEKASESGMDLRAEIANDGAMARYRKDPQIALLIQNATAQHKPNVAALSAAAMQPLPAATHE